MYYSQIKKLDIADGPGVRVTLFVSGCTNHCEGCFQPETWDFKHGEPFTAATQAEIMAALSPHYIAGLTLLGGEPMEPANQPTVLSLIEAFHEVYPTKNVWLFSGFTFEELTTVGTYPHTDITHDILNAIDVLVDGRFILAQKDLMLRFRGSSNQRILDARASVKAEQPVPWEDPFFKR